MKKMLKYFLLVVYVIFALSITCCLLFYNDYHVTQFGSNVLVIAMNDHSNEFKKGDLIIVKDTDDFDEGDNVFYYVSKSDSYYINFGTITKIQGSNLTIEGNVVSKNLVIGGNEVKVIPNLGGILGFLESRYGYLCLIILPIFLAFLYQLVIVIKESKNGGGKNKRKNKKE